MLGPSRRGGLEQPGRLVRIPPSGAEVATGSCSIFALALRDNYARSSSSFVPTRWFVRAACVTPPPEGSVLIWRGTRLWGPLRGIASAVEGTAKGDEQAD